MQFNITYLASTGDLRTVRSEDVPATIAKHLIATINLLEAFTADTTTVINTTEMSEDDVAKINMYDALVEAGVQGEDVWTLAVEVYQNMTGDSESAPDSAPAEAA